MYAMCAICDDLCPSFVLWVVTVCEFWKLKNCVLWAITSLPVVKVVMRVTFSIMITSRLRVMSERLLSRELFVLCWCALFLTMNYFILLHTPFFQLSVYLHQFSFYTFLEHTRISVVVYIFEKTVVSICKFILFCVFIIL